MAEVMLEISLGSYRNFTERFITAILDIHHAQIRWPTTPGEINDTVNGFARMEESEFETVPIRLPGIMGAMDGKLVRIHKPLHESSRAWMDRGSEAAVMTRVRSQDLLCVET
ncbi:hypothetical protein BC941DRAFT_470691 [Chlamydoabsidia padenii]|nr:hypothetical protein BC941DRAFT_470691 [Chlamydoabsidia padenii]